MVTGSTVDDSDDGSCYYTASLGEQSQEMSRTGSGHVETPSGDLPRLDDPFDGGLVDDHEDHLLELDTSFVRSTSRDPSSAPIDVAPRNTQTARPPARAFRIEMPPVPAYPIRDAQREAVGADKFEIWGTDVGRDRFLRDQQILLASWGVTPSQSSACVLVPGMWSHADPERLLERFDMHTLPPNSVSRLWLSRAAAWFAEPRRGVDIDNFFGDGPFMPMQGSHRCHHPHYVNPTHAVYDPAHTNSEREYYRNAAREFRRYGFDAPPFCDRHDRPCLMRQAALTTTEAYIIQFVNLCEAKGKPLPFDVPGKPPKHEFPTFETKLPVSFSSSSAAIASQDLVHGAAFRLGFVHGEPTLGDGISMTTKHAVQFVPDLPLIIVNASLFTTMMD
ncbi:hypothetical protein A1O7_02872 [Cladophialophora yegresii CBS 114405]|uniref:Uncharacterized protein n=1 Tax=Cladophialophora yegresii CBS 114405 TaxID=1182544 RepID=W9W2Z7_9EURO|nr:uncharacterized protein A1O7_02872 [Cladophialophora yegresii CBS 114405]EXJ62437.1 hypothetical protein A1O7_02872 [Cladophialophora yegresii CBS 114405]